MATKPYLTFASAEPFTIQMRRNQKTWNGILEWSTDASVWAEWTATEISSLEHDGEQRIYLRGTGNTIVSNLSYRFLLTGSNIRCTGNIENLLDYATVQNGGHPTMGPKCFYMLFKGCTGLISAPELPAVALSQSCYYGMFQGCTGLISVPELPATTFAAFCYSQMFEGCTGIKLSTVQTDEYWKEYRIPTTGEGQSSDDIAIDLADMFTNTGGTFTGTPEINTVYYMAAPKEETEPELSRGLLFLLYRMFSPAVFHALTGKRHWME